MDIFPFHVIASDDHTVHTYLGEKARIEIPKIPAHFTGTGDLFSALLLAWGHEGLQVLLVVK